MQYCYKTFSVWLTLPFLLATLNAMLGDMRSSSDSCSDNFFFSRSITFAPFVVLCRWNRRELILCRVTVLMLCSSHMLLFKSLMLFLFVLLALFSQSLSVLWAKLSKIISSPFLSGFHSWSEITLSSLHRSPHPGPEGWDWTHSHRWFGRSGQPVECTICSHTVALFFKKTHVSILKLLRVSYYINVFLSLIMCFKLIVGLQPFTFQYKKAM